MLVFEGGRGGYVTRSADGLRGDAAGGADVFGEAEGGGVDAEMVDRSVGDKGFSVDSSAEVHVEVCALGQVCEECMELERAGLCGVEGADGAGFLRSGLGQDR